VKVVVNATPLIALSLVERLDLLPQMFSEVLVPSAVYEEVVVQGRDKPGGRAFTGYHGDWWSRGFASILESLIGLRPSCPDHDASAPHES
jgi:hypothetical protein